MEALKKSGKNMTQSKYSPWVGEKIKKILKEGIRRNTRKPVSKKNPRRKVSQRQAIAVALSMSKRKSM